MGTVSFWHEGHPNVLHIEAKEFKCVSNANVANILELAM